MDRKPLINMVGCAGIRAVDLRTSCLFYKTRNRFCPLRLVTLVRLAPGQRWIAALARRNQSRAPGLCGAALAASSRVLRLGLRMVAPMTITWTHAGTRFDARSTSQGGPFASVVDEGGQWAVIWWVGPKGRSAVPSEANGRAWIERFAGRRVEALGRKAASPGVGPGGTCSGYAPLTPEEQARYAAFGPVSMSREAKTVLDQLELEIVSEINQREDQFNIAPTQKALVIATR
jgi:hypothetical protein